MDDYHKFCEIQMTFPISGDVFFFVVFWYPKLWIRGGYDVSEAARNLCGFSSVALFMVMKFFGFTRMFPLQSVGPNKTDEQPCKRRYPGSYLCDVFFGTSAWGISSVPMAEAGSWKVGAWPYPVAPYPFTAVRCFFFTQSLVLDDNWRSDRRFEVQL